MYREAKRESNVKILLVEDSKPIRRENETVLQQAGYEVICAEDGESALQMAPGTTSRLDLARHDSAQGQRS